MIGERAALRAAWKRLGMAMAASTRLRIAQVAPLFESVPPRLYGGTERIVSYLTEGLVRRGHQVTLFASGDSVTDARLVAGTAVALRSNEVRDWVPYHLAQLRAVIDRSGAFDVIHNHMDYVGFPMMVATATPLVTTLHGRLDLPDLPAVFDAFSEARLISISDAQRIPFAGARWCGTVYHGIPPSRYALGPGDGGYLAFIGRISPEKCVDSAIRVARATRMPLKVAAKVDRADDEYFRAVIQPLLGGDVEFLGEIGGEEKVRLLRDARALLFPIDWPEPFGLVMIEAMSCGTPVIARRRGSVTEVLDEGVTGFVCDDEDEMVAAVGAVGAVDRGTCREVFMRRFTDERMIDDYERIYAAVVRGNEA
jgi:glycosyltransferase involved in cell wall biosynthesis